MVQGSDPTPELERSNGCTLATRAAVRVHETSYEGPFRTTSSLVPLSSTLDMTVETWSLGFRLLNGGTVCGLN